jgi:hypothetical protein
MAGSGATNGGSDGSPHRFKNWLTIGIKIVSTIPKMICRRRCWAAVSVSMYSPRSGIDGLIRTKHIIR